MLRLNRYLLMLVFWLAFLFNVERLDLGANQVDVFNIATPIYVAAVAMVIVGLVAPQLRRMPLWQYQIIAVLAYLVAMAFARRPIVGGAYTYLSFFELVALLVTVTLAAIVGRLVEEFLDTVRSLMFSDSDGRIYRPGEVDPLIKREMQFARRNNRPLTVMVLDTQHAGRSLDPNATVREIQQLLARRHSLVTVTRLMARTLRRTDFVLDQTDEGRLVLVMPDLRSDQMPAIVKRLQERAEQRLGIAMRWGAASFPGQGVTFEELVLRAEQSLRRHDGDRRDEAGGSITEQLPVAGATEHLPIEEPAGAGR